jgi:hypothetical protein
MINANELRIGNWIKHGESPGMHEFPNTLFQVSTDLFYDIARGHISEYHLEPIPLTPELLEKCGFEKRPMAYMRLKSDSFYISVRTKHMTFAISKSDKATWRLMVNIKYLHQLQNLYFALTGKELEIDLNK